MAFASSKQSPRNRSISVNSELPTHDDKRPRLNAEQSSSSLRSSMATSPNLGQDFQAENELHAMTSEKDVSSPTVVSPNGKVTINTRPLSAQSTNLEVREVASVLQSPQHDTTETVPKSESNMVSQSNEASKPTPGYREQPISIPSSPSDSVIIHIGEPEDIEAGSEATTWTSISEENIKHTEVMKSAPLWTRFPYLTSNTKEDVANTIDLFVGILQDPSDQTLPLLLETVEWLTTASDQLERNAGEYVIDDYNLLRNLPRMIPGMLQNAHTPQIELRKFSKAFIRFCVKLVELDILTLDKHMKVVELQPSIAGLSIDFLRQWCQALLHTSNTQRNKKLRQDQQSAQDQRFSNLARWFVEDGALDLLQALSTYLGELNRTLQPNTSARTLIVRAVSLFENFLRAMASNKVDVEQNQHESLQLITDTFMLAANEVLSLAVKKQQTWLTIENVASCLETYQGLLLLALTFAKVSAVSILTAANVDRDTSIQKSTTDVVIWMYRFTLLKMLLKHGRMELRVFAIDTMASDLVKIWASSTRSPTPQSLLMTNYTMQFLKNNDMVKYILGLESHPQIVQRSPNVIGFLCVTEHWMAVDTDVAWQAVSQSQDPRMTEAVLEVMRANVQHLNIEALLYLHNKIADVRLDLMDTRMLEFIIHVLDVTQHKSTQVEDSIQKTASSIFNVCTKLLREACTPHRCSMETFSILKDKLCQFMALQKSSSGVSLLLVLSPEEREAMLETCRQEIITHSDFASGSIVIVTMILTVLNFDDAAALTTKIDYARLLVEDMVHSLKNLEASRDKESRCGQVQFDIRLSSFAYLVHNPYAIPMSLYQTIWTDILTSTSSATVRSRAWCALAEARQNSNEHSSFLQFVFAQLANDFPADFFDDSVLRYIMETILFEVRLVCSDDVDSENVWVVPGIDRLWRALLETSSPEVTETASNFMVNLYLESSALTRRPSEIVNKTQSMFVDKCITRVIDCAQNPSRSRANFEVSTPTSTEYQQTVLLRCLSLLKKFLDGLRSRSKTKPAASASLLLASSSFETRGSPHELTIQLYNHPSFSADKQTWIVGADNTASELYYFLCKFTGWLQPRFFAGGKRVDLRETDTMVKDLQILTNNVLLVMKSSSLSDNNNHDSRPTSHMDKEVSNHFDELYRLLESESDIARAIYDFLMSFSSQQTVIDQIRSRSFSTEELLPGKRPYRLLYHACALRACVEEESFSRTPDVEFLRWTIDRVIESLAHMQHDKDVSTLFLTILKSVLEVLLLAFKAKVSNEVSQHYFESHPDFVPHLLELWTQSQSFTRNSSSAANDQNLDPVFFECLIEATLHDERLWQDLSNFNHALTQAFLRSSDQLGRRDVLGIVLKLNGTKSSKTANSGSDNRAPQARFSRSSIHLCLQKLWQAMYGLVDIAVENATKCTEFFEALSVLQTVVLKQMDGPTILDIFAHIRTLFLSDKAFSNNANGNALLGLAKIMRGCSEALRNRELDIPDGEYLVETILGRFLFPSTSEESTNPQNEDQSLIDSDIRAVLYDIVLLLSNSPQSLEALVRPMEGILPEQDAFRVLYPNERQALRSEQGYAGLQNLSNTCYLNSLFSQLFMNIEFRELIMSMNIIDNKKQRLLTEMTDVFANMQSSIEKAITPEGAVEAITTFDGEKIDVAVQMDVDEFFNLLFDRLESQIVDVSVREIFKDMYGGQLVQQIKSKECEHVSERVEPFSAIQIEIRGKTSLEEGLAAYVEGEVLQGENKYSCSGCGRHVDAVKRACLKQVPNNLIFNLKRFDYDIMTGMRCKVNDEFQFPETIDVRPYTIDALKSSDQRFEPDIFELVGVIIHSGTAETGHYYSYIRERPSPRPPQDSWIQFNDADVSKFDWNDMRRLAFGGFDESVGNYTRFYNGYMLFYQRASSIETCAARYPITDVSSRVTLPLPQSVSHFVAKENAICLRWYVLQDATHAKFVRQLVEKVRMNQGACSLDHSLENRVLDIALDYIYRISSRWKEMPDFVETILCLCGYASDCQVCALNILRWMTRDERMVDMLLRSFYMASRKSFARLTTACLETLLPLYTRANPTNDNEDSFSREVREVTDDYLSRFGASWHQLQRLPRGWETYFGVLLHIAKMGKKPAQLLLDFDIVDKLLEIVWVHYNPKELLTSIRRKYQDYLVSRERNKTFNHGIAIEAFATLLPYLRLGERVVIGNATMRMTDTEQKYLQLDPPHDTFIWLKKLILSRANEEATIEIINELCQYPTHSHKVLTTMVNGLNSCTNVQQAQAYLAPCLAFIQHSYNKNHVDRALASVLELAADIHCSTIGGFLDFVKGVITMKNAACEYTETDLAKRVCQSIDSWAPPMLMAPDDIHKDTRNEAVTLLESLVLLEALSQHDAHLAADEEHSKTLRLLANGCNRHVTRLYLAPNTPSSNSNLPTLGNGQASQMIRVLEQCITLLEGGTTAEDEQVVAESETVIAELKLLQEQVAVVELDAGSEDEWEHGSAFSEAESGSESMA